MNKKKRYRFGKVSLDGIERNARPTSSVIKILVFAVFATPILWSFISDYWYHEDRPTEFGVVRYLWWHGIYDASVNVSYYLDGEVRDCSIHSGMLPISEEIIGNITPLTGYTGYNITFDVRKISQCRNLEHLNVCWLLNAERLVDFPNLKQVTGFINRPFENESLRHRVELPGWNLSIFVSERNIDSILRCENTKAYGIFLSRRMMNLLDETTLERLKAKEFFHINERTPDAFWENPGFETVEWIDRADKAREIYNE